MNCKWLWLLAIVVILAFTSLADARIRPPPPRPRPRPRPKPSKNCHVAPQKRRDCGFPGISRATCEGRGCCFSSQPRNAKWCFFHG